MKGYRLTRVACVGLEVARNHAGSREQNAKDQLKPVDQSRRRPTAGQHRPKHKHPGANYKHFLNAQVVYYVPCRAKACHDSFSLESFCSCS